MSDFRCCKQERCAVRKGSALFIENSIYLPQKDSLPEYLEMALKAKDILIRYFYDSECGGTYWSLNADYTPLDTKKQIYAIAFTIYGLAELNRATGDAEALEYAIKLFHAIEEHSFDQEKDGYFEAFTRTWDPMRTCVFAVF